MHKTFTGIVVSTKMIDTVIVEITRRKPHPIYKKLLKRSKKYKVALNNHTVSVGDTVVIEETRQVAKGKYFKIASIVGEDTKKQKGKEKTNGSTKE